MEVDLGTPHTSVDLRLARVNHTCLETEIELFIFILIKFVAEMVTKNSGTTHVVGQKQSKIIGLHDMSGHVSEWL